MCVNGARLHAGVPRTAPVRGRSIIFPLPAKRNTHTHTHAHTKKSLEEEDEVEVVRITGTPVESSNFGADSARCAFCRLNTMSVL